MTYTDSHVCCAVRANRMWWKAFERVALGQHKSFYPHRTQFAAVEQIIEVGDIWNYSPRRGGTCHRPLWVQAGRDRTGRGQDTGQLGKPLGFGQGGPGTEDRVSQQDDNGINSGRAIVAAKHLDEDEALQIPMRGRQRIKLAPDAGGVAGRSSIKQISAKLGPVYGPVTVVQEFDSLR
eukprot:CAMPEP_0183334484 /NCGR_PEP_ID=MMETSP0164_2-20130417/3080_1 /TAXON_ID=221442 /ORGANISM="Coccolithus pelagicus ssp braarudi, Strain PLY182g" /LENGTH=177 /DNA_ID=CAMNT_0025503629 /DNA_START=444 /DNA_END=978 /DNA_ORIENTATION=+